MNHGFIDAVMVSYSGGSLPSAYAQVLSFQRLLASYVGMALEAVEEAYCFGGTMKGLTTHKTAQTLTFYTAKHIDAEICDRVKS
jgi:hypothetical protein